MSQLYVNPKVVEIDSDGESETKNMYIFLPSENIFENLYSTDDKIISTYQQIFLKNNIPKKNIYIQGEPGTGKSTFCLKLAMDWCDAVTDAEMSEIRRNENFIDINFLTRFFFLFFISLREATELCSIEEMIANAIFDLLPNRYDTNNLDKFMSEEQCLIILDGLDEWSHPLNNRCAKRRKEIPHRRVETNCTFVTVTRPWKLNEVSLKSEEIDRCIEIKGVKNRFDLISRTLECLGAKDRVKDCTTVLESYDLSVGNLLDTPLITIQLVCIWNHDGNLPRSLCQLYSAMIDILLGVHTITSGKNTRRKRDISALPNCFRDTKVCLNHLIFLDNVGKLAYGTLFNENKTQRVVFSSDVSEFDLDDDIKTLAFHVGILTERKIPSLIRRKSDISFLHKSLQEFLAAFYLARVTEKDDSGKVLDLLYESHNEGVDITNVFLFVSGMCSEIASKVSNKLNDFIDAYREIIETVPFEALRFILIDNQQLMARAFNESVENLETMNIILQCGYIKDGLPSAFDKTDTNKRFQELFEINKDRLQVLFADADVKSKSKGDLIHLDLSPYCSLKLLRVVGPQYDLFIKNIHLTKLVLEKVDLSTGNIAKAIEHNFLLNTLRLIDCWYPGTDTVLDLSKCESLQTFEFKNKSFFDIGIQVCGKALRQCTAYCCNLSKGTILQAIHEAEFLTSLELIDCICTYCLVAGHSCILDLSHCCDLKQIAIRGCQFLSVDFNLNGLVTCYIYGTSLNEAIFVNVVGNASKLEKLFMKWCAGRKAKNNNVIVDLTQCIYLQRFCILHVVGIKFDIKSKFLSVCCLVNYDLSVGNIVNALTEAHGLCQICMVNCKSSGCDVQTIDLTRSSMSPKLIIEKNDVLLKFVLQSPRYAKFVLNGNSIPIQSIAETLESEPIIKNGSLFASTENFAINAEYDVEVLESIDSFRDTYLLKFDLLAFDRSVYHEKLHNQEQRFRKNMARFVFSYFRKRNADRDIWKYRRTKKNIR